MTARSSYRELVLPELRITVAIAILAEYERASRRERHVQCTVTPVGATGDSELVRRHLGTRVTRHRFWTIVECDRTADDRVILVHLVAEEIVTAAGHHDGGTVCESTLVTGRGGTVHRECRTFGNGNRRLNVGRSVVVADGSTGTTCGDTAVPRAVASVEPQLTVEVDAIRDVNRKRSALELHLGVLCDNNLADRDTRVHTEPVVV